MGNSRSTAKQEMIAENIVAIRESGELDLYQVALAEQAWQAVLDRGLGLILDLRETSYIEAHTFGRIIVCYRRAQEKGLKFAVIPSCCLNRILNLLPQECRQVLPLFPTEEEAVRSFIFSN